MSRCSALLLLIAALAGGVYAQTPVGQLFASDASVKGSVVMATGGAQVLPGSSVTAGEQTASLRLARGGELRICPRAALSVNAAPNGRDLMFGMSTGVVEVHYALARSADTILTPDFRIELVGPGEFHLAIGADARGDTCVRSLPENTASVIVTELMGNDVYQVPREGQVLFHQGSMKNADLLVPVDCGCPAPPPPVQRAQATSPLPPPGAPHIGKPAANVGTDDTSPAGDAITTPPPPLAPGAVHVSVDAPIVFSADAAPPPAPQPPAPKPSQPAQAAAPVAAKPTTSPELVASPPQTKPPLAKSAQKKGLFGHVRSLFAAIFR